MDTQQLSCANRRGNRQLDAQPGCADVFRFPGKNRETGMLEDLHRSSLRDPQPAAAVGDRLIESADFMLSGRV